MPPRPYASPRRRVAAEATRRRILEAARSLIGGKGDLGRFSMEAVAERAGVARMTVYYQFASRAALLEALADHLAERGGLAQLREVFGEPDGASALRKLIRTFVGFWASDRVTLRRIRAMGVVFPESSSGPRDRDSRRREILAAVLSRFPPRLARTQGSVSDLADFLVSLTSFDTFDLLSAGGRTPEQVADLLSDLGCQLAGYPGARSVRPVRRSSRTRRTSGP